MSFLSGILSVGKSVVGFLGGKSVWSSLARTAIMGFALNKLNSNANKGSDAGKDANIDAGVRLNYSQPSTASNIPVLYGSAFFGGYMFDIAMSADRKTMYYATALCEKTTTNIAGSAPTYTFKDVYWNNQRVQFKSDGVTVDYTRDKNGNIDRSLSGLVRIYHYAGGRTAGQVPTGYTGSVPNAETIFPNWTSSTHTLDNLIFAIVRVDYNREKNVTGIAQDLRWEVASNNFLPGDVLYDYLTSTRYGAAIPAADIDTTSLTALNTYSAQPVSFTLNKTDGTTLSGQVLADRYQINGILDTGDSVFGNIEKICNSAASWLTYDNYEGKWGVIINKSGSSVASFNDNNILGTISVSSTGLRDLYNSVKVEFPHRELQDSADFVSISLLAADLNDYEIPKQLPLTYDIINDPVQAKLLGFIELKQSRVDKVIQFKTDFSYINLKPGDVVSVTNSRLTFSSKLFRIITVSELQEDGALMLDITALEYDSTVYDESILDKYEVETADGIVTLGDIGTPGIPQVDITTYAQDSRPRVLIDSTSPYGIVEGMEFWLTYDVSVADDSLRSYSLITTVRPTSGTTFSSGETVTFEYSSIGNTNFIVKTRGVNNFTAGPFSTPSGSIYFEPKQVTDAIDANTQMFDSTGGLLTGLALVNLAGKLLDLFDGDNSKSIFEKIFDVFEEETGIDLVGDAAGGSLVVASEIEIKSKGTAVTSTVSSIDFAGGLEATAAGTGVTAKIIEGNKTRDILVWDNENKEWAIVSDCVQCDPPNTPPDKSPEQDCQLKKKSTLPANNFQGAGVLCPNSTSVPYIGSYFIKFEIVPGREGADPVSATSISVTSAFQWEIAKAGNTDFSWWGAPNNNVGTKWFSEKTPIQLFPNGKNVKEITVGKKYEITKVGPSGETDEEKKAAWEALGWEGEESTSVPAVEDTFVAAALGTTNDDRERLVTFSEGTGFVYGQGALKEEIPLVAPLVKGTGSFKLYGTDGGLEQTVAIGSCKIVGDVVEIPFAPRQPGKDYYIIWDEGIVTSCSCENLAVDTATDWTFTTSETEVNNYEVAQMSPTTFGDDTLNDDRSVRTRVDFSYTPVSSVCSNAQRLKLIFGQKVKKGTGTITIRDRLSGTTVATLPVSSATLNFTEDDGGNVLSTEVDFGTIPTLAKDKNFDVNAPVGLLLTDSPAGTTVVCDKTTPVPGEPDRQSRERNWGFRTDEELRIVSWDICREASGNAKKRTNLKVVFNKPIRLKTGTAEVTIFGKGLFGGTHQKIDLRGTYADKKYGDIYDAASTEQDNLDTATNEGSTSNDTIWINPTKPFKGDSEYYLNIPSGVIIDATCDVPWSGLTDDTTVAWKTDGAAPTPPESLTYGSFYFDFKFDRPVLQSEWKMNIIDPNTGELLKQISSRDFAFKVKDNEPFGD